MDRKFERVQAALTDAGRPASAERDIIGETTRRASRTLAALAPASPVLRILDPRLALAIFAANSKWRHIERRCPSPRPKGPCSNCDFINPTTRRRSAKTKRLTFNTPCESNWKASPVENASGTKTPRPVVL